MQVKSLPITKAWRYVVSLGKAELFHRPKRKSESIESPFGFLPTLIKYERSNQPSKFPLMNMKQSCLGKGNAQGDFWIYDASDRGLLRWFSLPLMFSLCVERIREAKVIIASWKGLVDARQRESYV